MESVSVFNNNNSTTTNHTADNVSSQFPESGMYVMKHYLLARKLNNTATVLFSILGVVTNIVNIATFLKMKLSDSVTLTFFCLSLFDLGYTLGTTTTSASQLILLFQTSTQDQLDPQVIFIIGCSIMIGVYHGSMVMTTYLALQRCCCVVLPFFFRSLFTLKRTTVIMALFAAYIFSFTGSYISLYYVKTVTDPKTNWSYVHLDESTHSRDLGPVLRLIDSVVAIAAEILLTVCVVVISISLRRSAAFRKQSTRTGPDCDLEKGRDEKADIEQKTKSGSGHPPKGQKTNELQVIKSVTLISILFVICNTPRHVSFVVRMLVPEFSALHRYSQVFIVGLDGQILMCTVNSSLNFFIYVTVNTKFKDTFTGLFLKTGLC